VAMIIVWAVASMSASATIAATLRTPAHLPATFGVFAPAAGIGATDLLSYFYRTPRSSAGDANLTLTAVSVLIAVVGLAGLLAWARRQSSAVISSEPSV